MEITLTPHKEFLAGFSVRGLIVTKKTHRFAAGFCCFQNFPPPAAGIYCVTKIFIFVPDVRHFCLENTQNVAAASRRDFVVLKKKFPPAGIYFYRKPYFVADV